MKTDPLRFHLLDAVTSEDLGGEHLRVTHLKDTVKGALGVASLSLTILHKRRAHE